METPVLNNKYPGLILPEDYRPRLDALATSHAFRQLKEFINLNLETEMHLHMVSAPLFVEKGTGVNDDLSGIERPVSFPVKEMGNIEAEVVQSLAKWKRIALVKYGLPVGQGIYTDMHAIRADEVPDNLHSLFVDQWDWELRIRPENRNLDFLKKIVKKIHFILLRTESYISKQYGIKPLLPEKVSFCHSEDLLQKYPDLTPRERENQITKEYGSVFIIGIGGKMSNGKIHDGRSPDYDDWSTPNSNGTLGLNGDFYVWHPVLDRAMEISSMGIRVDKEALIRQLNERNMNERKELVYHKMLLNDELPLTIGGGIGQSRLELIF